MHTYCHLSYELDTFSPKVRKYIAMHDTSEPWAIGTTPSTAAITPSIQPFITGKSGAYGPPRRLPPPQPRVGPPRAPPQLPRLHHPKTERPMKIILFLLMLVTSLQDR